ncbi:MAG: Fmu (Sun) domain protein [Chitinophagaceae bacterium]|nr:Fmu (Sun) domain protein [Chitinophagaceae bacterium]
MLISLLPQKLTETLLNINGFDKEAFEKVHASGEQITSIRLNPSKPFNAQDTTYNVPWSQYGFYLNERPSFTFDPLFHAGCYYVQEASSMFLEQALKQTLDLSKPLKVLDLCAAPGGKSTHIHSLISDDSLLVSNEVIRSRANILKDNIIKWGCENVVVTNNDPKGFSKLENYFDLIVVDAPCSGSGLFRRDNEAITEWSEENVELCSQRQQRILADVWPALKKNGILIYSTCSYSKEEDEDIVNWMMKEFAIDYSPLTIHPEWGIVDTGGGYRFWPHKLNGEGLFLSVFQKKDGEEETDIRGKNKIERVNKKEIEVINKWIKKDNRVFVKNGETIYCWPGKLANDLEFLLQQLHVIYSGVLLGEVVREKLIPEHSLAMSTILNDPVGRVELNYEQAIIYLQRKDLQIETGSKGWQLVTYKDQPLGWVNILLNRVNNYYPKSLRILKDR